MKPTETRTDQKMDIATLATTQPASAIVSASRVRVGYLLVWKGERYLVISAWTGQGRTELITKGQGATATPNAFFAFPRAQMVTVERA